MDVACTNCEEPPVDGETRVWNAVNYEGLWADSEGMDKVAYNFLCGLGGHPHEKYVGTPDQVAAWTAGVRERFREVAVAIRHTVYPSSVGLAAAPAGGQRCRGEDRDGDCDGGDCNGDCDGGDCNDGGQDSPYEQGRQAVTVLFQHLLQVASLSV